MCAVCSELILSRCVFNCSPAITKHTCGNERLFSQRSNIYSGVFHLDSLTHFHGYNAWARKSVREWIQFRYICALCPLQQSTTHTFQHVCHLSIREPGPFSLNRFSLRLWHCFCSMPSQMNNAYRWILQLKYESNAGVERQTDTHTRYIPTIDFNYKNESK